MRARHLLPAFVWCCVQAAQLSAHSSAVARLSFEPPGAVAGAPTVLVVQFEPPDGIDEELRNGQVRVVASMSGHAMPPVEIALTHAGEPGRYRGRAEFTMAGPWRLWFRAEGIHGVTLGTTGIDLGAEPVPLEKAMVLVQQTTTATPAGDAPLPFSPWAVTGGASGLTAILWSAAVVRKLVVTRRAGVARGR